MSSGSTEVYANFTVAGKNHRELVLRGVYLNIDSLIWGSPNDATICLKGGITSIFRNEVTLNADASFVTVHNHLAERC